MKYVIAIDADSPIGQELLANKGKIGGASDETKSTIKPHPLILATDLQWGRDFLQVTFLRNPGASEEFPTKLVVPARAVLFAREAQEPPQTTAQTDLPVALH